MEVDGMAAPEDYRFWNGQGTVPEADRGHDVYAGGGVGRDPGVCHPEQAGLRVSWQVLRQ